MTQSSRVSLNHIREPSSEVEYQNKDEAAIWDAFRAGNESAFIYIYETYFDPLFVYGNQFTKNEDLVKDAIQDLFITLRKSRRGLGRTDSIKFYLYKSLKRLIIKESANWFYQCEALNGEKTFDFSFSPEQVLIDRQMDEEKRINLNKAIESLSPRKREVIYYFYYEGMTYIQIQELMEMSHVKSARNLLYKAIDFLKQHIK